MNKKIIGCDIGGVLRDNASGEPIEGAIESINILSKDSEIIFISKAKDAQKDKINEWLKKYGLSNHKIIFCETYEEKASIAKAEKINIMIDDKITILSNMKNLNNIQKIWFCDDDQKINGTKKFNSDVFTYMKLIRTWKDVVDFILSI
jgi:hypothetical protein